MNLNSILIVGGGTAGWMTACMFAHEWQSKAIKIRLIESSKVGTVGVGEGSTPFLRDFFARLGIPDSQWMPECDATYKCGIDFPGWSDKDGHRSYFHPFYGQADSEFVYDFFTSCQQRRKGYDTPSHPDDYFIEYYLAMQNRMPFTSDGNSNGVEYGYHFDAAKLGVFLAKHARSLGVETIQDDIIEVNCSNKGIQSVTTINNGSLEADFFVDCSGFKGMLIQQALGEELINYEKYLPNNAAVAIQTLKSKESKYGTYTLSKGLQHGWMWSIPLQSRVGNGYVYSDKYIDKNAAEQALREELNEFSAPALHISWKPGRISQHWKQNCLAVGLSQGFLEPLEAPMLNLVQQTCESFLEHIRFDNNEKQQMRFNASINLLIDGTRDYLQAHYLLNTRNDSIYWKQGRENQNVSNVLRDIIDAWDDSEIFENALSKHASKLAYGKTSWYCILSGMNRFKKPNKGTLTLVSKSHQQAKQSYTKRAEAFVCQSQQLLKQKI